MTMKCLPLPKASYLHIHVFLPSLHPHPPPLWIEWILLSHTDKGMFAKPECLVSDSLFLSQSE